MPKHAKIRNGKEIFYSKLSVYLHLFKHRSQANAGEIYGVAPSTLRVWVKEFSRTRLESILKNFQIRVGEEEAAPDPGGNTQGEIRQLLMQQARGGSVSAAKMVLELERERGGSEEEELTVEKAIELIREWSGPRKCPKCGYEQEGKPRLSFGLDSGSG